MGYFLYTPAEDGREHTDFDVGEMYGLLLLSAYHPSPSTRAKAIDDFQCICALGGYIGYKNSIDGLLTEPTKEFHDGV